VLVFSSFVLGINTLFAVLGVFILRYRKLTISGAYTTFAYPIAPLIYLGVTLWTLVYVLLSRPQEGLLGLGIIVTGALIYLLSAQNNKANAD
jgi:APA family basic amino acid/polyamine antiporter